MALDFSRIRRKQRELVRVTMRGADMLMVQLWSRFIMPRPSRDLLQCAESTTGYGEFWGKSRTPQVVSALMLKGLRCDRLGGVEAPLAWGKQTGARSRRICQKTTVGDLYKHDVSEVDGTL